MGMSIVQASIRMSQLCASNLLEPTRVAVAVEYVAESFGDDSSVTRVLFLHFSLHQFLSSQSKAV